MSNKKSISYLDAQSYIVDKDKAIHTFVEYNIDKLQQIFVYANLPETMPQTELEKLLLLYGHCFVTKHDDDLYAFVGGFSGECDVYNNPRFYTVTNVALNFSETFEIGVDGVLLKNDFNMVGMLPMIKKYGSLMVEAEISMNLASILSRINMVISASDDKTKASADLFVNKIINGDFSVIGENTFFDGVKVQPIANTGSRYITQYIELIQYYKASFLNEIGLNANYNMKRERLTDNEIALNIDAIFPFIDNMFEERQRGIAAINEMFDCEIVVDYNSIWKTNHEEMEQTTVSHDVEMDVIGETQTGNLVVVKDDNIISDTNVESVPNTQDIEESIDMLDDSNSIDKDDEDDNDDSKN